MAEKEERILIKKEINYHPPYGGWRGDGKEIVLTRQEAIERMAEEIYEFCRAHKPEGYLWYPRNNKVKDTYRACAESALNALLGDK